jgi:hypothetical protein
MRATLRENLNCALSRLFQALIRLVRRRGSAAIEKGRKVALRGQGFIHEEDGMVGDHWIFNEKPGEIYFWLDNGGQFHCEGDPLWRSMTEDHE